MRKFLLLPLLLLALLAACRPGPAEESRPIEDSAGENSLIEPTGTFRLTVNDTTGLMRDLPDLGYYTPFTEFVFRCEPVMDADIALYVNGEFYAIQDCVETPDGYIWEYRFTMPIGDASLEFRIRGGM